MGDQISSGKYKLSSQGSTCSVCFRGGLKIKIFDSAKDSASVMILCRVL